MKSLIAFLFSFVLVANCAAVEYHVQPINVSGDGSIEKPFGLPDLPNKIPGGGAAMAVLQPGDTLTFHRGDYPLESFERNDAYAYPLICPKNSGSEELPITIQAAIGENVNVYRIKGNSPIFGTKGFDNKDRNFIRFFGFNGICKEINSFHPIFLMGGSNNEIAYCRIIGHYHPTIDNHDGIRINSLKNSWFHHNEIFGFTGGGPNSSGLKCYSSENLIFEDNYVHDCISGLYDKNSGKNNVYRRNVIVGVLQCMRGNEYGTLGSYKFYDNIAVGFIYQFDFMESSYIHDNLIISENGITTTKKDLGVMSVWNNIFVGTKTVHSHNTLPYPKPVSYADYNIYTVSPKFSFGTYLTVPDKQILTLPQLQAKGFEVNSKVVGDPLKHKHVGRFGDRIGPEDMDEMLEVKKYGPEARPRGKIKIQ
jgi:hypothetical protein